MKDGAAESCLRGQSCLHAGGDSTATHQPSSPLSCSSSCWASQHLGISWSHGSSQGLGKPWIISSFIQLLSFSLRLPHSMERQGFKLTTRFPPPRAPQASPKGCPCVMRLFLPGLLRQPLISRCWLTVAARGPITKAHCRAACGRLGSSRAHAHWYQQLPEAQGGPWLGLSPWEGRCHQTVPANSKSHCLTGSGRPLMAEMP